MIGGMQWFSFAIDKSRYYVDAMQVRPYSKPTSGFLFQGTVAGWGDKNIRAVYRTPGFCSSLGHRVGLRPDEGSILGAVITWRGLR